MTTHDKFADIHDRMQSLVRDLEDLKDERDERVKKDAHLAALMFRLVEQFHGDRRIAMPDRLKDRLMQFLEVGVKMGDIEQHLFGLEEEKN